MLRSLVQSLSEVATASITDFARATRGNVAITFVISSVALVGAAGAAVDFSTANSAKAAMQAALDSTALNLVKSAANLSSSDITSGASAEFRATFTRANVSVTQVAAQYDPTSAVLTLNSSGNVPLSLMGIFGYQTAPISAVSKAKLGGAALWPVCVMITNPDSNHTLLVKNQASIDFNNCIVQVNTQNWDAVEARDTSYIHSVNGKNCFVGDIHYGDVTPPKLETCDFLPDPYASLTVPANSCDFTNTTVSANTTLNPGTYCGGLKITGSSNVTFNPGIYYMQDGDFQILGSSSMSGRGVTFLLSGGSTNINFNTTGTINLSPTTAGSWAGFLFYWDQVTTKKGQTDVISSATANLSGIIYFAGQTLSIKNGANVTVNTGSIIADFLLPDNGHLTLTGNANSPGASLTKAMGSTTPVLVQ
jgi:Flp pilus assembly protein TadG